jgi:uncharacterized RDD family membrane protein YckC
VDQDFAVLTPEKAIVSYRLAGLGVRVGAHLLDLMIVIAVIFGIAQLFMIIGALNPVLAQSLSAFALPTIGAWPFVYFIFLEGLWNGQTLGKKSVGIRVRMADGTPITFGAAVGRNLLRPADMLPGTYFLGLLAMFTNPRSQRIGDQVANTVVFYERRVMPSFVAAPHVVGVHALEGAVGELKGMTAEEYDALKRLCDRYPQLSADTQRKLMKEVWEPIAARRGVPSTWGVHPLFLAEAVVMKYGRRHGLI